MHKVTATFRFYEELNDFLPAQRRKQAFAVPCAEAASVKHMIEALGVPHTEVELILVNGESVGFDHPLRDGERVAVYPRFEALDIRPAPRVRPTPLREAPGGMRFLADAHLGGLARLLRMAGFDTRFDNHMDDAEIAALAETEGRIILTRDLELLKRRNVTHGCFVHALKPLAQFREIVDRLDLAGLVRPFSRCLECNTPLREVAKAEVLDQLPPAVRDGQTSFKRCGSCGRVYWPGSHWRRMRLVLGEALAPGNGGDSAQAVRE